MLTLEESIVGFCNIYDSFQKITALSRSERLFGGGRGIRTPVGLLPNGFQDRLVMTASICLRMNCSSQKCEKTARREIKMLLQDLSKSPIISLDRRISRVSEKWEGQTEEFFKTASLCPVAVPEIFRSRFAAPKISTAATPRAPCFRHRRRSRSFPLRYASVYLLISYHSLTKKSRPI